MKTKGSQSLERFCTFKMGIGPAVSLLRPRSGIGLKVNHPTLHNPNSEGFSEWGIF